MKTKDKKTIARIESAIDHLVMARCEMYDIDEVDQVPNIDRLINLLIEKKAKLMENQINELKEEIKELKHDKNTYVEDGEEKTIGDEWDDYGFDYRP